MARKLSKDEQRCFQYHVRELKKRVPLCYPVRVRSCRLDNGNEADSWCKDKLFEIVICDESDSTKRIELLGHEYSHLLDLHMKIKLGSLYDTFYEEIEKTWVMAMKASGLPPNVDWICPDHRPSRWGPSNAYIYNVQCEIDAEIHR